MAEKDNRTATNENAEADFTADYQNGFYENAETESAEAMNLSGIDYIWGSDQDDLIKDQEKGV
ncbi:hypothetical protein FE783_32370 [Paenibacillus mesophilus]|uniref:hypothetical protein n=1 Tax=Paenibacillus mesophilus TaxID=2582849 RepID=UPI00110EFB95|nr:hypothetical protein [Paenibacillus mesophilus]TMV44359.1 hypothetical protein FE783_32370 [Paenibacillus mesophilus]